jgi:hypothetical protein
VEQVTPLMRMLRDAKERLLGTFEEGPAPPLRIRSGVELFARTNPKATIADWVEFAAGHAELSYRQGYVRGFERTERMGPDWDDPDEAAALLERLDQQSLTGQASFDAGAVVPVQGVPREWSGREAERLWNEWSASHGERRGPRR